MSNGDVITEIKNAIVAYPTNNVVITIESFERIAPAGGALNPPDKFRFKVKVVNKGCLDIVRAKALVKGTDYASVSLTKDLDTSFSSKVESTATFNVGGEGEYTTGYFYGKAKTKTDGTKVIVTATLSQWDASWEHLLNSHSMAQPKVGELKQQIFPT